MRAVTHCQWVNIHQVLKWKIHFPINAWTKLFCVLAWQPPIKSRVPKGSRQGSKKSQIFKKIITGRTRNELLIKIDDHLEPAPASGTKQSSTQALPSYCQIMQDTCGSCTSIVMLALSIHAATIGPDVLQKGQDICICVSKHSCNLNEHRRLRQRPLQFLKLLRRNHKIW